jgi:hypothetical protein
VLYDGVAVGGGCKRRDAHGSTGTDVGGAVRRVIVSDGLTHPTRALGWRSRCQFSQVTAPISCSVSCCAKRLTPGACRPHHCIPYKDWTGRGQQRQARVTEATKAGRQQRTRLQETRLDVLIGHRMCFPSWQESQIPSWN